MMAGGAAAAAGLNMDESWRELRIGDRIRLVAMPNEFAQAGYFLHPSTRRVYERLIARNRPVRVYRIDDWGLPWIECKFRERDGRWACHSLAFNHDGWVRVLRRPSGGSTARPPRPIE
jgi:hypothetical protein